jgi:putative mRNA 3-end processing factor
MEVVASDGFGLWVPAGAFHVDPSEPVARAVVTHPQQVAALDLCGECICTDAVAPLVRKRWPQATVLPLAYRERLTLGRSVVSLHPSGHALGAAQVRVETDAGVAVITGAYKRRDDPTCPPYEPVVAAVVVLDATYALPIFRWPDPQQVVADLHAWWEDGRATGRVSILSVDASSIAARILALLARRGVGPVRIDASLTPVVEAYRSAGIRLPDTVPVPVRGERALEGVLLIAPSATRRRFAGATTALASGAVQLRGARRRAAVDRGFVLSDHADWGEILQTVDELPTARVLTTGAWAHALARYLRERGREARVVEPADHEET